MIKDLLKNPTKIYANYLMWFTKTGGKHLNLYDSSDPEVIRKQILMAKAMGIDGFVCDWYNTDDQPSAEATEILATLCGLENFEFSIMLDAGAFKWKSTDPATRVQLLQTATDYVMGRYAGMPNYSQVNGRPLLWEFGWRGNSITAPPKMGNALLLSQDATFPGAADDATFAWVKVPDSNAAYLKSYLAKTTATQIPAIFFQFDDHDPKTPANSIWGGPARFLDPSNGDTFIGCIEAINATGKTYPAIQICTWNDYEERTCIEPFAKALTGTRL